jgi:hypothetical protein
VTSAHFIYIPVCILIGVIFGWILGGRAARDAYLAEIKRREAKAARQTLDAKDTKVKSHNTQ